MDAKKCDRCGSFYSKDDVFTAPSIRKDDSGAETSYNRMELFWWPSKIHYGIDLCPNCGEHLYNWLSGAKKEAEPTVKPEETPYEDDTDKHCESCKWHIIKDIGNSLLHECDITKTQILGPDTMTCPNWEEL